MLCIMTRGRCQRGLVFINVYRFGNYSAMEYSLDEVMFLKSNGLIRDC